MALIKCPECGNQLSDKASACPHCGCPVSEFNNSEPVKVTEPIFSETSEQELIGQPEVSSTTGDDKRGSDSIPSTPVVDNTIPQSVVPAPTPISNSTASPSVERRNTKSGGNSSKGVFVVLGIVAVVAIIVFCVFKGSSGDSKVSSTNSSSNSQNQTTSTTVPDKAADIKRYAWKGKINGKIDVDVHIEICDDKNIIGQISYGKGPISLVGYKKGSSVCMAEFIDNGKITGFMEGTLSSGNFNGKWRKSLSAPTTMQCALNTQQSYPTGQNYFKESGKVNYQYSNSESIMKIVEKLNDLPTNAVAFYNSFDEIYYLTKKGSSFENRISVLDITTNKLRTVSIWNSDEEECQSIDDFAYGYDKLTLICNYLCAGGMYAATTTYAIQVDMKSFVTKDLTPMCFNVKFNSDKTKLIYDEPYLGSDDNLYSEQKTLKL